MRSTKYWRQQRKKKILKTNLNFTLITTAMTVPSVQAFLSCRSILKTKIGWGGGNKKLVLRSQITYLLRLWPWCTWHCVGCGNFRICSFVFRRKFFLHFLAVFRLAWLAAVKLMMPGQFLLFCLVWFGFGNRLPLPINMQHFWMAESRKKALLLYFNEQFSSTFHFDRNRVFSEIFLFCNFMWCQFCIELGFFCWNMT